MELIGTITKKLSIESGVSKAGKDWKKQSVVLDMNKDWNSEVCIEFFGDDKVALVSGFEVGTDVKVGINVSSRAWNDKYFHSITGWRMDLIDAKVDAPATAEDTSNDLPF